MMKTYSAKAAELNPQWYVIDAEGQVLGRLASQIAQILRGKHKPTFTPHLLSGDFVVVINADKIAVTGKRLDQKMYYRHSQYPGGLKTDHPAPDAGRQIPGTRLAARGAWYGDA